MFQLFDLIITSPIGVLLINAIENVIYAALILSDCEECAFNDLGKLLFGGVILAVAVGISVSLLYRRIRDKETASQQFVSIRATKREE